MKRSLFAAVVVACALAVPSYDVLARGTPSVPDKKEEKEKKEERKAPPQAREVVKTTPPPVKTPAPMTKPAAEPPGPAAKGAPPPLAKVTPDASPAQKQATTPPVGNKANLQQGKPVFDAGAAAALKAQEQQAAIKKAEDARIAEAERLAAAKRESDAAIARAKESARRAALPVTPQPQVADRSQERIAEADRIRRLEQANRDLRSDNRYYRRQARAAEREAELRSRYRWGSPYAFRVSYADIFVGSVIWSMWSSWDAREQARWLYHHQYQMDQRRYDELLSSNYQLRAEVQSLERQQMLRDINYVPSQLRGNEDLMYAQNAAAIAQEQAAQTQAELARSQADVARAQAQVALAQERALRAERQLAEQGTAPSVAPPAVSQVSPPPVATAQVPNFDLPPPSAAKAEKESGGSHWFLWTMLACLVLGSAVGIWWLRQPAKGAK